MVRHGLGFLNTLTARGVLTCPSIFKFRRCGFVCTSFKYQLFRAVQWRFLSLISDAGHVFRPTECTLGYFWNCLVNINGTNLEPVGMSGLAAILTILLFVNKWKEKRYIMTLFTHHVRCMDSHKRNQCGQFVRNLDCIFDYTDFMCGIDWMDKLVWWNKWEPLRKSLKWYRNMVLNSIDMAVAIAYNKLGGTRHPILARTNLIVSQTHVENSYFWAFEQSNVKTTINKFFPIFLFFGMYLLHLAK